ncbi:MAG: polysaccharide deacetylase family protein [Bryobacteraceae bacterium]|nr:polysaccharide deacetylase family protein [Bryobacteraceae bacterium]
MFSNGILTVSLDFELFWGVRDTLTVEDYGPSLLGVHEAAPRMLALFERYGIHATWAPVGFLFFQDADELERRRPPLIPRYTERRLNPYVYLDSLAPRKLDPRYHFAPRLIRRIVETPHQELATHTFSHYFCLEPGQTSREFRADLEAAIEVSERMAGRRPVSLIFPRNQFNPEYLYVCADNGIRAYRGNQNAYAYEPGHCREDTIPRRAARLLDSYVNLSGHHGYSLDELRRRSVALPYDVPASMVLRPWSRRFKGFEKWKAKRIKDSLTWCAERSLLYHLWWHPHNFGVDIEENLAQLEAVLEHFAALQARHGMKSLSMAEVADLIDAAPAECSRIAYTGVE